MSLAWSLWHTVSHPSGLLRWNVSPKCRRALWDTPPTPQLHSSDIRQPRTLSALKPSNSIVYQRCGCVCVCMQMITSGWIKFHKNNSKTESIIVLLCLVLL